MMGNVGYGAGKGVSGRRLRLMGGGKWDDGGRRGRYDDTGMR